nr:DUF2809 domain-containing protein [Limnofasciculus baicalensis]
MNFLKYRIILLINIILIIPLGYTVRFSQGITPEWLNDCLGVIAYQIFWILFVLFIYPRASLIWTAIGVFFFACGIEFLQLWQPSWLQELRGTLPGRLVLGNTFTWTDFPPYIIGSFLGWLWVRWLYNRIESGALSKTMNRLKKIFLFLRNSFSDSSFLHNIESIETIVSKILSLVMVVVILVAVFDLIIILSQQLFVSPLGFFNKNLFEFFGLFLNVLIALEILENITAYLRKHVVQVELVIVTSLIAVARKIIILDLKKTEGIDIIGLALAVFSLSLSYWIIRKSNEKNSD